VLEDDDIAALGDGGFVMRDGLLGAERALAAARAAAALPGFRPASVGRSRHHDPETRGDALCWLDAPTPPLVPLLDAFAALRDELNASAWLGLGDFEVQVARYDAGGARYARHRDAFVGRQSRIVTAIYYLNPGWAPEQGGALRLHLPAGPTDVAPLLDRLVVFLSDRVEHEVLPVHAPRLAITAWYRGRNPLP
jgi:SM-20-related protein